MNQNIKTRCEIISKNFKEINTERKIVLEKLASHIQEKLNSGKKSIWFTFARTIPAEVILDKFGQELAPIFMVSISIHILQEQKLLLLIKMPSML